MKALLINVNFETGQRAGGCCPNDRNLHGHHSWQCTEQGLEIRIVKDGDVDRYRNVEGVRVLEGEDEIRAVVRDCFGRGEPQYRVVSDMLMVESIRQMGINLAELPQDPVALLKGLFKRGVHGIVRQNADPIDPAQLRSLAQKVGT